MFVIRMAVTFFMTPVLVKNLGNHDYGIWELVVVAIGYMGLLDLGIRPAISRFIAFYRSREDRHSLLMTYSTAFVYMLMLGIIAFFSALILAYSRPGLLAGEGNDLVRYQWLLLIVGMQMVFMFPGQIAESSLEGFQKYYLSNNINVLFLLANSALIYMYITPTNALLLVAASTAVASALKYVLFYMIAARQHDYPAYFASIFLSMDAFRNIFRFSLKTFIQGMANTVSMSVDRLIISVYDQVSVIIYFVLPANLIRISDGLIATMTNAMMPFFADLHGRNDKDNAKKYFLFGSKVVFSVVVLVSIGIYLLGSIFIGYWIGNEYVERAQLIINGLLISNIIFRINPLGSRYLVAMNRHGILAKTALLNVILVVPSSIFLVKEFGYVGAAYSGIVPELLVTPIVLSRTCNIVGINMLTYGMKILVPSLIPALGVWAFIKYLVVYSFVGSMGLLLGWSLLAAFIFYVIFAVFSITGNEKKFIMDKLLATKGSISARRGRSD